MDSSLIYLDRISQVSCYVTRMFHVLVPTRVIHFQVRALLVFVVPPIDQKLTCLSIA